MTKSELMEKWKYIKKSLLKPKGILIELFADNGDKKYLYERDIDGQMRFIDQNYDENLIHLKCRDMQITKVMFYMDTPIIEVKKERMKPL